MCGIAEIMHRRGAPVPSAALSAIMERIAHRGPDGAGTWFNDDKSVALGHRRLAIIDPGENGRQPMVSPDGRYVTVYNGEVYNFLELRRELETAGHIFRTESDTEVILAAWRCWNSDMLLRFNGMWAFAIFDTLSQELFLARDRFGVKPLLYAETSDCFVFASELRALARSGLFPAEIDISVAQRMMLDPFGVEGSPATLYRRVQRLQPGHWMKVKGPSLEVRRWWRTVDHFPSVPGDDAGQVEQFGALFRDAVALRMRSDVPIGTCLSGGFNSSAILCTMASLEREGAGPRSARAWRHAFVASFPGMSNDERPQAEEAAAWADVRPRILNIEGDAIEDIDRILDDLDHIYIILPSAIWRTYRLMRQNHVPVSLDGHGADELMGAYRQKLPVLWVLCPKRARRLGVTRTCACLRL